MPGYLSAFVGGFLLILAAPFTLVSGYTIAGATYGVVGLGLLGVAWRLRTPFGATLLILSLNVILAIFLVGLTDPGVGYDSSQARMPMDGITTIEDAVKACQETGFEGWALVAYAQNLAARKFTYSRRYPWDSPARAFERGQGYCQQQALALKKIYDGLGIESRVVYAARCRFPSEVINGTLEKERITGHTWLRVKIGGEELDVCPGNTGNRPGVTNFETLSAVVDLNAVMQPVMHLFSVVVNLTREPR